MKIIGVRVFPFCIAILRTRHRCLGEKPSGGPQFPAWGSPLLSSCDRPGFPELPGIPGNPWDFPGILGIPKATLQNREFPSTSGKRAPLVVFSSLPDSDALSRRSAARLGPGENDLRDSNVTRLRLFTIYP